MSGKTSSKKMTLIPLILMIFTSVFGFNNIVRGFFNMGYFAIPWYILSGICVFLPYAFMMAEFGAAYKDESGGIYTWMDKSVGPRFAFMGTFMWYVSYVIWMVTVSQSFWAPFSNIFFGTDKTKEWSLFGLDATKTIGILAIALLLVITIVGSRGLKNISKVASIGGTFVALLNIVLLVGGLIVLVSNGGLAETITENSNFFKSPNSSYQSGFQVLSFVVFAIFAYGGIETIGGLVDQTEDAERTFPKGVAIAAIIITIGYALGIFMVGTFTNWTEVLGDGKANLSNVAYVTLKNLGYQIGDALNMSESTSLGLGSFFARFAGFSMCCAYLGAFFTLSYSPLKQLIEGTPKEVWPAKLSEMKDGMPKFAMWVQCAIAVALVALTSFGGGSVEKLFNNIVNMTNVAMTLPIVFLSLAYIKFKKDDSIKKNFVMFKTKGSATFAGLMVAIFVILGNIFTIITPAIDGDLSASIYMVVGPIAFSVIALILYAVYESRYKK